MIFKKTYTFFAKCNIDHIFYILLRYFKNGTQLAIKITKLELWSKQVKRRHKMP